jgi:hypothetical protein
VEFYFDVSIYIHVSILSHKRNLVVVVVVVAVGGGVAAAAAVAVAVHPLAYILYKI